MELLWKIEIISSDLFGRKSISRLLWMLPGSDFFVLAMGWENGSKKESQQAASKMAVKRLRTDKELQQRISATKKKKAGELTDEKEFSDLPEEETVW